MNALLFRYSFPRFAFSTVIGKITERAYFGPGSPFMMAALPEPDLPGDDWVLIKTRMCGICGSDSKQVFLDGNFDNPLTAFVSFPQVLGHEVVGFVEEVGPGVKEHIVGDRILLNPWLPCLTRGINPPCRSCQRGNYYVCENFTNGKLPSGMHTGNNSEVIGGYAPLFAAHKSQIFTIPDGVSTEDAVLTDPISVSLHGILKAPPEVESLVVVYGCGTLGLLTILLLKALYPSVEVFAVTRYPHQEKLASELGADYTILTTEPSEIIERIAEIVDVEIIQPWKGKPMLMRGAERIYDTVGSPESIETGIRLAEPLAKIVITGVAIPKRFEWTPLYFKEIELIGSNAFGMEDFEGERRHTFDITLDLLKNQRLNPTGIITHHYKLEAYKQAFLATHHKEESKVIKAVFDYEL